MSHDFDPINNHSNNEHFQEVLTRALANPSRRSILRGGVGLASMFALPMLPGCGGTNAATGLPALAALMAVVGYVAVQLMWLTPALQRKRRWARGR